MVLADVSSFLGSVWFGVMLGLVGLIAGWLLGKGYINPFKKG